ncbi:hypothetical protein BGZ61DRAFT_549364 [Ilyonectria robusta]|uniref:uncharacterized protein n=1 Tax=Ilyonectria robusta TaxID=1079257 RepID=UPI001E8DF04A|nr:uncharacterized protein BGZ61DRAFT_549364 [Ilyonectria robusta]KAH8647521.1 hypothetical protein BGZ61DRAFT_549364 [Ilyonectria robusta]
MSSHDLFREYQGQIVSQSYNAGFVALSYVVSLVGAGSTLELINRRTAFRGLFNHLLLVSSAVTMGGVAIWCMHFIGNRAIDLANGEPEMQIAYSSGFTAVSFFIPILVLLAAFLAIGTNNTVSWWRVIVGGVLCGTAVCGMHYLGNASIENYTCVYRPAYVVGAAFIAVVASIVALAMFFVFRAMWANAWWKRAISAVFLAGAVSGMHWCAAMGTQYRLKNIKPEGNEPSRSATVIVVICLSLGACFIIAVSAILRARNIRKSALRAQQVTLGAAVFDNSGRILVDPDGFIPSTVVTDSFLEKNSKGGFGIGHPLFQWMFQASRNWGIISILVGGMRQHVSRLPHSGTHKDIRRGIRLISEHGEMIERYDVIFRELFCLAAAALADRLREDLTSVGVLWDEILPTGANGKWSQPKPHKNPQESPGSGNGGVHEDEQGGVDMAEKGLETWQPDSGRGSLMLLIRRVESDRDAERFVSAGYRFAEPHQVSDIIRSSMQIQTPEFETKLRSMSTYTTEQNQMLPGVHLGFFAVRARVSSGFEVLVRKGARHLLPSMALPTKALDKWHVQFLRRFENMSVSKVLQGLEEEASLQRSARETEFADAVLTSTIVSVPCRGDKAQAEATMIAMRLVIPIHSVLLSQNCEFVPLGFFKMRQVSAQFQQEFTRGVHQEFGHIVKLGDGREESEHSWHGRSAKFWPFGRADSSVATKSNSRTMATVGGRRFSLPDSTRSGSTINLWPSGNVNRTRSMDSADGSGTYPAAQEDEAQATPSYGGIMVFQEITIDVEEGKARGEAGPGSDGSGTVMIEPTNSKPSLAAGIELQSMGHIGNNVHAGSQALVSIDIAARKGSVGPASSFVDILFAETVESL